MIMHLETGPPNPELGSKDWQVIDYETRRKLMNDFDYLNRTLSDWLDEFFMEDYEISIRVIEDEYLIRYTAALIDDLGLV